MSFQLKKGDKFQIKKSIGSVLLGCGWDPALKGETFDLDASAFGLVHPGSQADKARFYSPGGDSYPLALTYANAERVKAPEIGPKAFKSPDGSMMHHGDNRTGVGKGDDEIIEVNLEMLPAEVVEVALWVTIYEAGARKQTFERVNDAFARVLNKDTGEELCRYPLTQKFVGAKSVHVGSLVRTGSNWEFVAVGVGAPVELGDIIEKYMA